MMIQNTTFLRRAVGSLLVALVTLVGFQANAQLDFSVSTEITWDEDPANVATSLAALQGRITEAIPTTVPDNTCYTVSGVAALEIPEASRNCRPDGATATTAKPNTGISSDPGSVLAIKADSHVDYDVLTGGSPSQTLTVTAYNTSTKKAVGTLTVAIKITNYDEQPMTTQNATTNKAPVWYLSKGDSRTVLISGNFRDPEGAPVYFDSGATSTDVWVCDSATAGDSAIEATFPDTARTDAPGADVTVGGADSADCTVSNTGGTSPAPGIKGTAGNRVVTTRKVGPILHITADSLVTDTSGSLEDPNTDLVDRPKGTYTAVVYYRVWTGPATGRLASSDWSMATVHVKIGANNLPQFAGGATGYNAEMNEGTNSVDMTAWVAGDLDEGGVNNDMLSYKLVGDAGKGVACAGGTLKAALIPGDSTASPPTEDLIRLSGTDLDYETATMCTVNLQVTDNWSDPVSVPITVTVKNVNELNFAKKADGKTDNKIANQNMVNGLKRTFDLDDYFVDPEGDPITYTAHTNIYTNVVSVGEGNVLTVTGANATEGADSVVTVTITASDGKGGTLSHEFVVTTRASNDEPKITLVESGTIAIGASIDENGSKGEEVATVACTDDDPYPAAILTGSDHFTATSSDSKCEVKILVDTPLNFEAANRHVLKLVLQDQWDETVMSKSLEIQVNVVDQNDAPTVAKAYQDLEEGEKAIDDQNIVVDGSGSIYTGMYFEDEDGDRLLVNAASSDMTKVTVMESGLDGVKFYGVAETEEDAPVVVTLTATDPEGASATLTFNVNVSANTPPVADADAFMASLPADNTINVGGFHDIDLDGLFSDMDGGDMVTGISASSSDSSILMVIVSEDGGTATLVGRNSGEATLTITAMDGGGNSTSEMAEITVNAAPEEAVPLDPQTLDRVTPHVVDVSGVFTDSDDGDDSLTITAEAIGDGMDRVTLAVDGMELTITGVMGIEPGDVEIQLTATDPHGSKVKSTFMATVINIAPTVAMSVEAQELDRIAPLSVDVSGVFADVDGDIVTITASVPDGAVIEVGAIDVADGMLMVTALAVGDATVTLDATDNNGAMISDSFMVTVNNVDPVVANALMDQTTTRLEDLSIDVSDTFSDPDTDSPLTLTVMAEDATIAGAMLDGTMLMVEGLAVGMTTITVTATDADGGMISNDFMVTIDNVEPVVAFAILDQTVTRIEDLTLDISETFSDPDMDALTITVAVADEALAGAMVDEMSLIVEGLDVGTTTITLTATDVHGGMVSQDFMVEVLNTAPTVAMSIQDMSFDRTAPLGISLTGTFADADGMIDTLSVMVSDDSLINASLEDMNLTLTALAVGTSTVTLTAVDDNGADVMTSFMVTVVNIEPVVANAVADQTTTRIEDITLDISDTFNDPDAGNDMLTITASVADGSTVAASLEGLMLSISGLSVGTTSVTLTAVDADGGMVSDTFMTTIENVTPVVANAIADQTTTRIEDLMLDVSTTFSDPDGDMLTLSVSVEDGETVEAALDGHMLSISGLEVGMTSVTLTAVDVHGGMVSNTFTTTIENIEPVVANSVADQEMDRRAPLTLDLSETFLDADNGVPTITVTIGSGAVLSASDIDDNMMLSLTALAVGETVVTLTATDVNGASVSDDFKVTIINIEPVVANAIADQTTTRVDDLSIDVGMTFDDPDQDNSMLTITVMVADQQYVDASLSGSNLMITGLDVGATMVTLTAVDADGGMVETTFTTTVENIAPVVANSISPINLEVGGQPASQAIAGLFSDDGDPLSYSIASANGGIASTSISGMTAMVGPVSRGSTTFTITATDPHGGSASVTGSVTVGDGELKAVAAKSLAAFGRALIASVSSSVGSRVMTDARSSDLTLDAWAPVENQGAMAMNMTAEDRSDMAWNTVNATTTASNTPTTDAFGGQMTGLDALRSTIGQNFALNLGSSENPSRWAVWGDIDRQSYEGAGYDGMASSVYLGADVTVAECWIFGVAVSSSSGESDYSWGTATQTMDLSLTTILPYVSYQPSEGSSIWGVAGFGSGELDTTVVGTSNDVSDLTSTLTMVGGSQELTTVGRFNLALRGDAATVSLETEDGNGAADGLAADINRIRVGLEGSFRTETGQGGMLEPFGQISLRSDGGDGDTGTGVEVAGGVRMTSSTFTLEAQGRTLAMHGADEYSESGFSLMAKLNPSQSATGVSVTIAPRWGADALGNGMLWQDDLNVGSAHTYGALTGFGNADANKSIDTQIGYGMLVANEQYLLTPFVDYGVSDSDRRELLLGVTLQQLVEGTATLDVNLALGRVEERTGASSGKIGLNAVLRF